MNRSLINIFEDYQKARSNFVQTVAELASRSHNIQPLFASGILPLLRPLLLDSIPSIQHSTAVALGRLANHSKKFAEEIVNHNILPQIVYSLSQDNKYCKCASAFVIRTIARHSPELAKAVVESNALESLASCLQEFDPTVKESAAWAVGYIARHNEELAKCVSDYKIVKLLVSCYNENDQHVKQVVASVLCDISKHTIELAQEVVDTGVIETLSKDLQSANSPLKKQILSCLGQISKHSSELAHLIVSQNIFPQLYTSFKDSDEIVRKNTASLIREIVRHDAELTAVVVNSGGTPSLIDYINEAKGQAKIPGIIALGHISAFSETLAFSVISAKGLIPLKSALKEPEDHIKAASSWTLEQIGRHTPEHSYCIAEEGLLRSLILIYTDEEISEDLKIKSKQALKGIIEKCTHLTALNQIIDLAPPNILKILISQFAKVLPNDPQGRKTFVQNGCLKKLLALEEKSQAFKLNQHFSDIRKLFPQEIVNFYSPNYSDILVQKMDSFLPHT